MKDITSEQLATTLAALRYWQREVTQNSGVLAHCVPHQDTCYFEDGTRDGITPLDSDGIDALCAQLASPIRAPGPMPQHHMYGHPKCPCPRCNGTNPAYADFSTPLAAVFKPLPASALAAYLRSSRFADIDISEQFQFNEKLGFHAVPTHVFQGD